MREFKCSAGVIIQAPYEAVVEGERDCDGFEDFLDLREVGVRGFAEKLGDAGKFFDDWLIFRDFAIEDAQRIRDRAALAVGAHLSDHGFEGFAQSFVKSRAVGWAAYGVEFERP